MRLFSPVSYFRHHGSGHFWLNGTTARLVLADGSDVPLLEYEKSLLPTVQAHLERETTRTRPDQSAFPSFNVPTDPTNLTDPKNDNLTAEEKELLAIHWRLGHPGFQLLQTLITQNRLSTRLSGTGTCRPPICSACLLAKMTRRGANVSTEVKDKSKEMSIKRDDLQPGDCASIDQYESRVRGRLSTSRGNEQAHTQYCGGTIFADHASGFLSVQHQVTLGGSDTVRSKRSFEQECREYQVSVHEYHGDNGVFKAESFAESLESKGQTIHFSGTGAHHQNAVAERAIRTSTERARTLMVHAAIQWPEQVDANLWPFALDYAVYQYNHTPNRSSGFSPIEIFSGTKLDTIVLPDARTWGCPTYVLDPTLQDGKKIPKWKPRSRRGQFLGISKSHATSIGLVRNLRTGYVSPQFHVIYDELFQTIHSEGEVDLTDPVWAGLMETSRVRYLSDESDDHVPPLHRDWMTPREQRRVDDQPRYVPRREANMPAPEGADNRRTMPAPEGAALLAPEGVDDEEEPPPFKDANYDSDDDSDDDDDDGDAPLRYPVRTTRNADPKYGPKFRDRVNYASLKTGDAFIACGLNFDSPPKPHQCKMFALLAKELTEIDTGILDYHHPLAFSAKANDEDTPNYRQAMSGPDCDGYLDAMELEMAQLRAKKTRTVVPRTEALALGANIIGSTWVLKRKRYPDGSVRKLKARLCARGDQQVHGVDYFDTYAPVVSWTTVRTLLTMSCLLGLETQQVDYTLAFCQAVLDDPIYCMLKCPSGTQKTEWYSNSKEVSTG
jgi:hypothetical protein